MVVKGGVVGVKDEAMNIQMSGSFSFGGVCCLRLQGVIQVSKRCSAVLDCHFKRAMLDD
jgi:hypothetical protein